MMRPIASRVALPAALYICFVGYYVYLHAQLGRGFPLPWPDEASFLWPATNFAETGSLLISGQRRAALEAPPRDRAPLGI